MNKYFQTLNRSPQVAIVILNWNGRTFLQEFLPSVLSATYAHYAVIVADNGSTDDSIAFLQATYPQVQIINNGQNYGFAKGYNEALKRVESDYYILLNSDVEVSPGWIEPMVILLESNMQIAACQPKILSYHNKTMFEYAGAAGGWLDKYGYPFAKGRVFDICEEDKGQYDQEEPVFWASGAAMFIRASVFHEMKGFDEYFFAHQEEIDLCWRIQLAGYKVFSCPAATVYHVGGGTLPKGNALKTFLNFRNNRIMLYKNLPFRKKLWVMPARNVLDVISAFKGLLSGDVGYFKAVIRAEIAFKKWWLFHRKRSTFPSTSNGVLHGYLNRNIIWLYFVKKLRIFSQIVKKTK
ncbi:MAG: glycosyltransferase family 2 protein [Chitinophagaceae bacterium]|nr:glycosyltransferase family 2 protein [Chitinophagaceae bacterium]MBK8951580.1 glycosyltransferase family 2 protein [Chitinophagaceae bacterium]